MMRLAPVLAGGFLLITLGSASAATVVEQASLASTALPTGGLNATLTIDRFDVANATLTAIELQFTGGVSGTVSLTRLNNGPRVQAYPVELGADFALTVGPSAVAELQDVVASGSISIDKNAALTGSASLSTSGSVTAALAPALFAQFIGPGSVNVALAILRDNLVTAPTNAPLASQTFDNFASAELMVTYTYTANDAVVPEPLSLSMFGLGLLGLAVVRRRAADS
ncbi:choice-of-anchor E domain-containing protein [Falsiroseomonas sp.]|uniref:choice-of-anchor E domain-containing protein n=1 Tax=Falsiroseomonas sp. TaxID=2870721 RepID=UPI003565FFE0